MTHRRPLLAAACAGMFVFGIVMALLGAVLPSVSARLHLELSAVGALFLFMNGAMLATSLGVGPGMDRFGMKAPLAAGAWLVAASVESMTRAPSYAALAASAVVLGIGGGALNAASNTLVADLYDDPAEKSAALNFLGIFFGFGALFLPFLLGASLDTGALHASAVLCVAAGLLALTLKFPAAKQVHGWPIREMPRFLRQPLVLSMAFLLFFQSGNEFTLGGFLSTYLTSRGYSLSNASWLLALYWASIMAARLFLSRFLPSLGPGRTLAFSAAGATAGCAALAFFPSPVFIILAGFSLASIFPTLLGVAGAQYPQHSGTVFGILFTIALCGGMTLPWIAGIAGQSFGLHAVFVQAALAFVAIFLLQRLVLRLIQ